MATLDVTNVTAIGFPVDTTIVPPKGDPWVLGANRWIGIPSKQGRKMIVSPAGAALCMLKGSHLKKSSADFVQVMTIDEVRQSA